VIDLDIRKTFNINRALKFIALFLFLINTANAQLTDLDTRCLWIVRESMMNKTEIDSAFIYAYQSGYDIVFVQVRGRGDALYNSNIVPSHPNIPAGFDPLDYATKLGHALGLEVHAWINSYILWSSKFKPQNQDHLYHAKPAWTEADLNGKMDWRIDLKSPKSPQWEGIYLSPIHPEVNPYLQTVYKEIIDKYNIDGIHFDYIRYQDDFYGYNPQGRKAFEDIYGIDPRDIVRGIISTRYGWQQTYVDSMKNAWKDYRQNKVTELVEMVRQDIILSGKDIKLSAAVKPNLVIAQDRWFQDWKMWLKSDLVDFVVPMNYFKEIKDFNMSVQIMKNNLSRNELDMIIMGIATYNQDAQSAADKVLMARLNGFHGVSVFSYDSHKYNLEWFQPVLDALGNPFDEN